MKKNIVMNQNKIRYDLIPNHGLMEVHKILTEKLNKYDKNQWKYGLPWSDVLSSLKKHLSDFEIGKDFTEEGLLSIAEVAANALILADYYKTFPQGDDRIMCPVTKPRIALDIDDVCLDFKGAFEKRFNIKLNPYWDGTYQMKDLLEQLKSDKNFWINLPTLHKPNFEPYCYITSRSIPDEWTKECLEKNGFPCAPVYSVSWNESKIPLLKEYKIDILIDDKPTNYHEATKNGIFCYLMDNEHNSFVNCGHRRIYDLNL